MRKLYIVFLGLAVILSGCVARTYQLTQDRVDQNLSEGNRGYIMGRHPGTETPRKTDRTVRVFEFELGKSYQTKGSTASTDSLAASDYAPAYSPSSDFSDTWQPEEKSVSFQKYKVEKNDTLQKISQKFYGTTRKWNKIFEANKELLKTPDRLYPGQVLMIPEESAISKAAPSEGIKKIK